jgi:hypothetical protein
MVGSPGAEPRPAVDDHDAGAGVHDLTKTWTLGVVRAPIEEQGARRDPTATSQATMTATAVSWGIRCCRQSECQDHCAAHSLKATF